MEDYIDYIAYIKDIAQNLIDNNMIINLFIGDKDYALIRRVATDHKSHPSWETKLVVNDIFLGWCNVRDITMFLTETRLSWPTPFFMTFHLENNWLYVNMDLPLVITNSYDQLPIFTCEHRY